MHLEGSAGSRPLCTICAELRRRRIHRNRLIAYLHLDEATDQPAREAAAPVTAAA
jgi:hypothetical protein